MTAIKLPVRKEPSHIPGQWIIASDDEMLIALVPDESHADAIVQAFEDKERMREELDAANCTLEDEEAAHQDTLRLWNEAKQDRERMREALQELATGVTSGTGED